MNRCRISLCNIITYVFAYPRLVIIEQQGDVKFLQMTILSFETALCVRIVVIGRVGGEGIIEATVHRCILLISSRKSIIIALSGDNMIKTTAMLHDDLKDYVNPTAKIRRLVANGDLVPIIRGLYETDRDIPGHFLAPIIYGPSYLSFEFALAFYSLIPEAVYNFTSATFEKRKTKQYTTPFGTYSYQDVPSDIYPFGLNLHSEHGYGFMMASPEKAICDELYKIAPVKNVRELEELLFENLRVDQEEFFNLNLTDLQNLSVRYHTQNHKLLHSYLRRRIS